MRRVPRSCVALTAIFALRAMIAVSGRNGTRRGTSCPQTAV